MNWEALVWIAAVSGVGTFTFARFQGRVKEPWVWFLWGGFIGALALAGGIFFGFVVSR